MIENHMVLHLPQEARKRAIDGIIEDIELAKGKMVWLINMLDWCDTAEATLNYDNFEQFGALLDEAERLVAGCEKYGIKNHAVGRLKSILEMTVYLPDFLTDTKTFLVDKLNETDAEIHVLEDRKLQFKDEEFE